MEKNIKKPNIKCNHQCEDCKKACPYDKVVEEATKDKEYYESNTY